MKAPMVVNNYEMYTTAAVGLESCCDVEEFKSASIAYAVQRGNLKCEMADLQCEAVNINGMQYAIVAPQDAVAFSMLSANDVLELYAYSNIPVMLIRAGVAYGTLVNVFDAIKVMPERLLIQATKKPTYTPTAPTTMLSVLLAGDFSKFKRSDIITLMWLYGGGSLSKGVRLLKYLRPCTYTALAVICPELGIQFDEDIEEMTLGALPRALQELSQLGLPSPVAASEWARSKGKDNIDRIRGEFDTVTDNGLVANLQFAEHHMRDHFLLDAQLLQNIA